jgi:hypothetical protein
MRPNPYTGLPQSAYWRTGIADRQPLDIEDLWQPKYAIAPTDRIVTSGSCFAQHIGRALRAKGFAWFDAEPSPPGLPNPSKFNYGVFSFRTGNIYTTALLRQWLEWATSKDSSLPSRLEIWEDNGRYFDPFRPAIEPTGFASAEEVITARKITFSAIRRALTADVFVFTLGLTEAWRNDETELVYPACPGTLAGTFDKTRHKFVNFDYVQVERDLRIAVDLAKAANPNIRFLLTVSPVPLTATASGNHVLVATSYSKSVLRAVAGRVSSDERVDYFPSYELITGAPFRAQFYAPNLREVEPAGVAFVMSHFFANMAREFPWTLNSDVVEPEEFDAETDDVICEEMVLESFRNNE